MMDPMQPHIERILDSARTAPSRDNLQPWRFVVDDETVSFSVDAERDSTPDGAMARIALGAALECTSVSASRMGATVKPQPPREGALITLSFTNPKRLPDPDLSRMRRVTNRRLYDGRALDDATLLALRESTPERGLAQAHWFGRERVRALGPLFEQAEELRWLDDGSRARSLATIRFDVKDREEVERGLSIGSLELTSPERAALTDLRKPGTSGVAATAVKTMATRARRLVESASGVCILTTRGTDPMAEVDVGRLMQRVWMTLTQRGLAAHPMTTVMSLAPTTDTEPDGRLATLLTAFRQTFPNVPAEDRIAFLMRFGWADAPSVRVGRLPLEQSVAT
jgi:hypothetical protein